MLSKNQSINIMPKNIQSKKWFKHFIDYVNYSVDYIKAPHINLTKLNRSINYMSFMFEEKHKDILKKTWNIE